MTPLNPVALEAAETHVQGGSIFNQEDRIEIARLVVAAYLAALPVEAEPVTWMSVPTDGLPLSKRGTTSDPETAEYWKHSGQVEPLYPARTIEKLQADLATAIEANKALMAERSSMISTHREQLAAYVQSVKDLGGIVRHNITRAETAEALASSETERADSAWNDAVEACATEVKRLLVFADTTSPADTEIVAAIRNLRKEPT